MSAPERSNADRWRAFRQYARTSLVVAVVLALVVGFAADGAGAVWPMVGLAYVTQLVAFGMLIAVHGRERFMVGWGGGIAVRFAVLGLTAVWVAVAEPARPALRLLTFAGALFVLVLLEPVYIRQRRKN